MTRGNLLHSHKGCSIQIEHICACPAKCAPEWLLKVHFSSPRTKNSPSIPQVRAKKKKTNFSSWKHDLCNENINAHLLRIPDFGPFLFSLPLFQTLNIEQTSVVNITWWRIQMQQGQEINTGCSLVLCATLRITSIVTCLHDHLFQGNHLWDTILQF